MLKKLVAVSVLSLLSAPLFAAECAVEIEGTDAMQYNLKQIEVPATCKEFTVTLKHVGSLPVGAMGHNWILTHAGDMQAVAMEGMQAGPSKDYIVDTDERIIAHTKLIGGGESDSVTFDVSKLKAGEKYQYFCSFPGHFALMNGELTLK